MLSVVLIYMETFLTIYILQIFILFVIIIFCFLTDDRITVGDLIQTILIMIVPVFGLIIQILFMIKIADEFIKKSTDFSFVEWCKKIWNHPLKK